MILRAFELAIIHAVAEVQVYFHIPDGRMAGALVDLIVQRDQLKGTYPHFQSAVMVLIDSSWTEPEDDLEYDLALHPSFQSDQWISRRRSGRLCSQHGC